MDRAAQRTERIDGIRLAGPIRSDGNAPCTRFACLRRALGLRTAICETIQTRDAILGTFRALGSDRLLASSALLPGFTARTAEG